MGRLYRIPLLLLSALCLHAFPAAGLASSARVGSDTLQLPAQIAHDRGPALPHAFTDSYSPSPSEGLHLGIDRMLLSLPGVSGVRTGGIGSYMAFALWGSGTSQVEIFIDGIPVNHAADGIGRLGDLDPSRVAKIEIFKGASPSFLPGNPIGGVIHVTTHSDLQGANVRALGALKDFGGLQRAAEVDWGSARLRVYARLGQNLGDNNYGYLGDQRLEYITDENGTRIKTRLDLTERRLLHNGHALTSGQFGITVYPDANQGVSWWFDASHLKKQFHQVDADEDLRYGAERESQTAYSGLSWWRKHGDESRSEINLDLRGLSEEFSDRLGVMGTAMEWDLNGYGQASIRGHHTRSLMWDWSGSVLFNAETQAHQYEDKLSRVLHPPLYRYSAEAKPSMWREFEGLGLFKLQGAATYLREEYYRGIRYSAFGQPMDMSSDRLQWDGLTSWQKNLSRDISLEAQAATGHRHPTFLERFGDRGVVKGNPALTPERSQSIAGGFRYAPQENPFRLTARLFHRRTREAITANHNSQRIVVFENTDRTLATGEELALAWERPDAYNANLAFTHQSHYAVSSRDGDGYRSYTQLPFVPVWSLAFSHGYRFGFTELRHLGNFRGLTFSNPSGSSNFYDPYADNREIQARHDIHFILRVGKAVEASFAVENIFNQSLFDFFGSPLPPRTFGAALTARY